MSFRKRTLTKPNIGALRKKTSEADVNTEAVQAKTEPDAGLGISESSTLPSAPLQSSGTKLAKRVKAKVNIRSVPVVDRRNKVNDGTVPENTKTDLANTPTESVASVGEKVTKEQKYSEVVQDNQETSSPLIKSESAVKETEIVVNNDSKTTEKTATKRLAKRLKVGPKLSNSRTSNSNKTVATTKNEDVKSETPQDNHIETTTDTTMKTDTNPMEVNTNKTSLEISSPGKPSAGSSKLQKRKQLVPNLVMPSKNKKDNPCSNSDFKSEENDHEQVSVKSKNISPEKKETESSIDFDATGSSKKSRHVHFEGSGDLQGVPGKCNDLELLSEVCSREQVSESHNENCSTDSINNKNKKQSILKKDTYDYSSQSEGEATHSTTLSKGKKVFKPNLGARRRKRLSSFSAYSSCDEEDDEGKQKKQTKSQSDDESCTEDQENLSKRIKTETEGKGKKKCIVKKNVEKENKELKRTGNESEGENEEEEEIDDVKPHKKTRTRINRKICTEERDISTLTMQELIFYRPKSLQRVELRINKLNDDIDETATLLPTAGRGVGDRGGDEKVKSKKEETDGAENEDVIAPQVMLDENGDVVINESSLMIRKKVDDSLLKKSAVVYEDALSNSTHRRKVSRVKRWKMNETLRFYKALSQIGTDFTLMAQAFGRFTRNELKKKFKQEEKVNCDLVDMALSNRLPLNMEVFLRGKEEMQEILDEEIRSMTSEAPSDISIVEDKSNIVKVEKKGRKKAKAKAKPKEPTGEGDVDDLPECFVQIEPTEVERVINEQNKKNNNNVEVTAEESAEHFTDFQRTLSKSDDHASSTSGKNEGGEHPPSKKRRLRVIDDSDDEEAV